MYTNLNICPAIPNVAGAYVTYDICFACQPRVYAQRHHTALFQAERFSGSLLVTATSASDQKLVIATVCCWVSI